MLLHACHRLVFLYESPPPTHTHVPLFATPYLDNELLPLAADHLAITIAHLHAVVGTQALAWLCSTADDDGASHAPPMADLSASCSNSNRNNRALTLVGLSSELVHVVTLAGWTLLPAGTSLRA